MTNATNLSELVRLQLATRTFRGMSQFEYTKNEGNFEEGERVW